MPLPGAKPREIRAALHPEYRDEFDWDYQESLNEAGRTLDLEGIHDTLEHWRMRSWITRDKPEHCRAIGLVITLTGPRARVLPVISTEAGGDCGE